MAETRSQAVDFNTKFCFYKMKTFLALLKEYTVIIAAPLILLSCAAPQNGPSRNSEPTSFNNHSESSSTSSWEQFKKESNASSKELYGVQKELAYLQLQFGIIMVSLEGRNDDKKKNGQQPTLEETRAVERCRGIYDNISDVLQSSHDTSQYVFQESIRKRSQEPVHRETSRLRGILQLYQEALYGLKRDMGIQ